MNNDERKIVKLAPEQLTKIQELSGSRHEWADYPRIVNALLQHIDAITPPELIRVGQLELLPPESVVRTPQGYTLEKLSDGWYRCGLDAAYHPNEQWLPATLIFTPRESPDA